jgi:hypothetical protein
MGISGLKTFNQAQFLCWAKGFNTRNIIYIPAFESLGLAFLSRWVLGGALNLIEGFETTFKNPSCSPLSCGG